jgi:hypothetical protein
MPAGAPIGNERALKVGLYSERLDLRLQRDPRVDEAVRAYRALAPWIDDVDEPILRRMVQVGLKADLLDDLIYTAGALNKDAELRTRWLSEHRNTAEAQARLADKVRLDADISQRTQACGRRPNGLVNAALASRR